MAKKYKPLLTNVKPVYSKDTQLAQLMYQVRDNKNLPSNAPKQIKPFTPKPKQEQPQAKGILADAFDTDETYLQKFKRGNIGGGVANLVGSTLTAGQTLLSNIANNISSLSTGHGLQPYRAQMDNYALEQEIYKRTGAVPISERISKINPALGTAYRVGMDIASDPIELTPLGFLNDIKMAKGAAQNTQAYGKALQQGKLPGYGAASGIKTAEPPKAQAVQPTNAGNVPFETQKQTVQAPIPRISPKKTEAPKAKPIINFDKYKSKPASIKSLIDIEYDKTVENVYQYLKNYKPKGVDIGVIAKNGDELMRDGVIRYAASENDIWYQDFYRKYHRAPRKSELRELAEELVNNDLYRPSGEFHNPDLYKLLNKTDYFVPDIKPISYDQLPDMEKYFEGLRPRIKRLATRPQEVPPQATIVQPRNVTKGINDLGADTLKQSDTASNLKRKGALPKGEIPARDVDIPANTPYGDTQRFARTLAEAKIVDDTLLKDIQDAVSKGSFAKFTKSNKTVVDDANKIIADEGFDGAYNMFKSVLKADKQAKSSDIALGIRLLQDAQKAGDYEKALDISIDLSQMLSETGRTLQAATIAKRLSPEGRLLLVQRTAKKVSDKYGVKVEVSDDIVEKISKAKTEKEIIEANAEAAKEIWDQVPATWMDKVNAWRYMSMLTNPKTHLRNIFGNALFVPAREFKNIIGAGLEKKFVKEGERTKAILNPKTDADLIKFARSDFKNVKAILKSQGKLDDTVRNLDSKIFDNKVLEKARELNMNALDAEDTWFMKFAYDGSLAQYMKANKLKPADMVGETLDKARKYAMNEAWRATYRDINAFSNLVSKGKHYLAHNTSGTTAQVVGRRIGGMAIEAVLPFAKTPVNILRRGVVDYSPIGIANGMIKMSKDVKAGKVTAAEAIDNIASGLSGTGIMALGVFLGYRGIVTGEESDWRTKEGKYTDIQGTQNYALNLEDGSYTLDWAAPLSLPFFVGVEIAKGFRDEGFELSKILDSMTAISDPLFNMTMLQGMNQIISTNMEGVSDAIFKTATGYASQYVPTVLGQVARTVDGTRRDTRSTAETNLERQVEKFVYKQIAKIPGASMAFPEYVDLWGRTQDSGGAIQQFLSPGYYKDKNITPVDKEINRLVKNLGNDAKDAIPSDSSYTIKRDGRQYRMSEKELAQFKKTRGQAAYNNIQALIKTVNYRKMTDEDKVKAIRKIHNEALKKAQAEYLRKASPK
jgi:hypothetical protein